MKSLPMVFVSVLVVLAATNAHAEEKKGPTISDKTFRRASFLLLDDPLSKTARDSARLILLYTLQKPNAAVGLSRQELRWIGKGDQRSLLLLAAYAAGDVGSQLNSGVKRNDRYSGLLCLFRVYRALREKEESFKVSEVEDLLQLHQEGKLVNHLQKLEEKTPTKLSPAEEQVIRKLMERK